MPPLEGEARRRFLASAQQDFIDYSLIADAEVTIEGDRLVLRLPLAGGSSDRVAPLRNWRLAIGDEHLQDQRRWAMGSNATTRSRGLRHPVSGIRNRHPAS